MSLPTPGPVLTTREDGPIASSTDRRGQRFAQILAMLGFVLMIVAWTHIALIIFPPHFGVAPWEFAAATQTIDVFPLAVTGVSLLACGCVLLGWPRRALALAIWCIVTTFVLVSAGVLTLLDFTVAWGSVTSATRESLMKTSIKVLLFSLVFTLYHIWLAIVLLRSRKDNPRRR